MFNGDPRDDEYGYAVKQTYLYLRLGLVGTIAAIFLAVALTPEGLRPEGQGTLQSISHYYYSPARIVFVGALCAAALALLTLAGKGIQSYLLDIAALLAPLIALVPTPVKLNEVGAFDPKCASQNDQCIPAADFEYVRLGFRVWFWLTLAIVVIGFVRAVIGWYRDRKGLTTEAEKVSPLFWVTLLVASAILAFLGWNGFQESAWFQTKAHFLIAGTFFIIVSFVAWIEALRQWRRRPGSQTDLAQQRKSAWGYILTYGAIGLVLLADMIVAGIIIFFQSQNPGFAPVGVFRVELVGLILFAAFFAVQTIDHRHDGDGWGPLPLTPTQQQKRQAREQQREPVA